MAGVVRDQHHREIIRQLLELNSDLLTPRERGVLRMWWGLTNDGRRMNGPPHSDLDIQGYYELSDSSHARQIRHRAEKKLREPATVESKELLRAYRRDIVKHREKIEQLEDKIDRLREKMDRLDILAERTEETKEILGCSDSSTSKSTTSTANGAIDF